MNSLRNYSRNRGAKLVKGRWRSVLRGTPVYESWRGMKKRCLCPNHDAYHNYGGRGIRICAALIESPLAIIDSIGNRPKGKTLDRFNNEEHYTCGACDECFKNGWLKNIRWATPKQQARNSRVNHLVKINGIRKPACEWAEILGLSRTVFYQRLHDGQTGVNLTGPLRRIRRKKK